MNEPNYLRVGLPNRSSLLHVAAICIAQESGLITKEVYHPAKLFYEISGGWMVLTRCDELAKRYERGELDIIITGFDYDEEFISRTHALSVSIPIFESRFALLGSTESLPQLPYVLSKFPRSARRHLDEWGLVAAKIEECSGGTEGLCMTQAALITFDVICTGATAQENQLHVYRQGPIRKPRLLSQTDYLAPRLLEAVNKSALLDDITRYYDNHLQKRDFTTMETIDEIMKNV